MAEFVGRDRRHHHTRCAGRIFSLPSSSTRPTLARGCDSSRFPTDVFFLLGQEISKGLGKPTLRVEGENGESSDGWMDEGKGFRGRDGSISTDYFRRRCSPPPAPCFLSIFDFTTNGNYARACPGSSACFLSRVSRVVGNWKNYRVENVRRHSRVSPPPRSPPSSTIRIFARRKLIPSPFELQRVDFFELQRKKKKKRKGRTFRVSRSRLSRR